MERSIDLEGIINKHYVFFVREGSPAFRALRRVANRGYRPGMILPVSEEELESLRKDLLAVQVKDND